MSRRGEPDDAVFFWLPNSTADVPLALKAVRLGAPGLPKMPQKLAAWFRRGPPVGPETKNGRADWIHPIASGPSRPITCTYQHPTSQPRHSASCKPPPAARLPLRQRRHLVSRESRTELHLRTGSAMQLQMPWTLYVPSCPIAFSHHHEGQHHEPVQLTPISISGHAS